MRNFAGPDATEEPRSLRDRNERERRSAILRAPHISPLTEFAASLRTADLIVPNFDPMDGGIDARMLFLFEKPGPKTDPEGGSGFISRDNDDATAEATFHFMREAFIPRQETVIWNVIPYWNSTVIISKGELPKGRSALPGLLKLLPKLKTVVLVGGQAGRAKQEIEARGLKTFKSYHPARKVRNIHPDKWASIPNAWAEAWHWTHSH